MKFINLVEPLWGETFIKFLNNFVNSNYILSRVTPVTADIFVFSYPIYLAAIYLYGINQKKDFYKNAALYVFFSWVSSVALNLFIQMFVTKQRPEDLIDKSRLLLEHIPDASFPSDHAAMSAAIAMSVLLWGIKNNNKWFKIAWIVFWGFSIIMCLSRIAAGVHWPTDIIFWMLIWVIVSYILITNSVYKLISKYIFSSIIKIEKFLFRKLFWINQ